jgi:putative phosphoribosyl transferase
VPNAVEVAISVDGARLAGVLETPDACSGIVLFAHGSGSGRHSPRNRQVAGALQSAGIGTLLLDLLTAEEDEEDRYTARIRFDVGLLARRLAGATEWVLAQDDGRGMPIGYFGASTGAAAALIAAADLEERVAAVVSRGGRADLAGAALERVTAPALLVVGERDGEVLDLNREAYARMHCTRELVVVPCATHLFEEPGALEQVSALATEWFLRHLLVDTAYRPADDRDNRHPAAARR